MSDHDLAVGLDALEDITASFCCHAHFLAGEPAAVSWREAHAGGLTLPLDDAFELGRLATRALDIPHAVEAG